MKTCRACGSDRVIPPISNELRITSADNLGGRVEVVVQGDPNALIMKDRHVSNVVAYVCGACGFLEMFAARHDELYAAYLAATRR